MLSAFAVGSLGGSLIAARLAFKPVGRVMLVGAGGMGLTLVVAAAEVPVPVIVGGALIAGVLNTNVLVSYITLRTMLSPDALLGRVGATARTLSVGLMPVGALVTGILLDTIGGSATMALMGTARGVGTRLRAHAQRAERTRRRLSGAPLVAIPVRCARHGLDHTLNCPSCGSANEAGRKFCGECGRSSPPSVRAAAPANQPSARFCGECGTPMATAGRASPRRPASVAPAYAARAGRRAAPRERPVRRPRRVHARSPRAVTRRPSASS